MASLGTPLGARTKKAGSQWSGLIRRKAGYFFARASFFAAGLALAAVFFAGLALAAAFTAFAAGFFAAAFFFILFAAAFPGVIGVSQQMMSAVAHPHASSTVTTSAMPCAGLLTLR